MGRYVGLMEALEGGGIRRWYVATDDPVPVVLAGPFPTRKRARHEVFLIARAAGDPAPWPSMERFDGYPGFYAMHTGASVYYVGRAAPFSDQGSEWCDAMIAFEDALALRV